MHPYIPVRVNRQRHDGDAIITAFTTVSPLISCRGSDRLTPLETIGTTLMAFSCKGMHEAVENEQRKLPLHKWAVQS
jgi:hypothetical protein